MPAKRDYNVKGTNDFLILAAIFFLLCLWAIKDAWFPSERVLKKHPMEVQTAFEVAGSVKDVNVAVGDKIGEKQLLAELRSDRVAVKYDKAKETYSVAKDKYFGLKKEFKELSDSGTSAEKIENVQQQIEAAQQEMDDTLAKVDELRIRLDASELKSPSKGVVQDVLIAPHTMVEAGQTVIVIDPKDHFYMFNKSLTVLSAILCCAFLAVHVLAR